MSFPAGNLQTHKYTSDIVSSSNVITNTLAVASNVTVGSSITVGSLVLTEAKLRAIGLS